MKLWQKNYLLTALLFTAVLFVCAAVLLALTGRNTMQRLTESAVSEEKAIAGALDSMVLHEDERIDAVLRGIANQYKQSGVYLRLVNGGTVYVDLLPYPPKVQTGELRWEAEAGRICISIGEAFPEGFTMTYCKDVTAQAQTAQRGLLLAAGLCFLLSAGVNAVLYAMMLRVNLPLSIVYRMSCDSFEAIYCCSSSAQHLKKPVRSLISCTFCVRKDTLSSPAFLPPLENISTE